MESNKVFFKIVVPNYNNFKYIKKCLDSILTQTFTDWFCVVVDDQSTDESPRIAQLYKEQYPHKFDYIRLEQKGYAGAARNKGIDYSIDSEYTWFIDSDDWIYDNNVLERIYDNAVKNNFPDVIRCSFQEFGVPFSNSVRITTKILTSNIDDIMRDGAQPSKHCIRSSFKCKFIENRAKNNDVIWFLRIYDRVDLHKISVVQEPCFVYNRNSEMSCQNNIDSLLRIECAQADRLIIQDELNEELKTPHCRKFRQISVSQRKNWYKDVITVEQFFENSFIITIDDNRFNRTMQIFKTYFDGLCPTKKVIGSHNPKLTGPQNCTKSHLGAIRYAKEHDLPFAVVFEDDAYPRIDAKKRLQQYLYRIPKRTDFLLLGWSNHSNQFEQQFNKPFNLITTIISGSHSYIIFKSAYDRYIEYIRKHPKATADGCVYNNLGMSLVTHHPIFIQYSDKKSMNNHVGYTFYGDHNEPPTGFSTIDFYLAKQGMTHNEPPTGFSTIDITKPKETKKQKHLFDPDYDADF